MNKCACGFPEKLGTHWMAEDGECCPPDCECEDCQHWEALTVIEVNEIDRT